MLESIREKDKEIKKLIPSYKVSLNPKKCNEVINLINECGKEESIILKAKDLIQKRYELLETKTENDIINIKIKRGFCIPYNSDDYTYAINEILNELKANYNLDLNSLLCHYKSKDIKTGKSCGYYNVNLKEEFKKLKKYKSIKIKFFEGKGSPNGVCRGSNGFVIEGMKCNLLNLREKSVHDRLSLDTARLGCKGIDKINITKPELRKVWRRFQSICVNIDLKKKIIDILPEYKKNKIIVFLGNSTENTRRPLKVENNKLKIDNNDIKNISDIRIHFKDNYNKSAGILFNSTEYISQKSSKLVTFFNLGIDRNDCLKKKYIEENNITSEIGVCLLKTLGIDINCFCGVFNNYANNNKSDIKKIADKYNKGIDFKNDSYSESFKNDLQGFLNQCMGNGNMIISHYICDKDIIYRSKKVKNNIEKYNIYYGGKTGEGKRIDIEIYTKSLLFNINIRNKCGGIYPSHIMCDFKYHNDQMLI